MNIYDRITKLDQRVAELETLIKEMQNASISSVDNKDTSNRSDVKESTSRPRRLSRKKLEEQA
tara:strand:+ start:134 stop:322 length:189 start_codon:yes stop_codon:yes gene_type:complete